MIHLMQVPAELMARVASGDAVVTGALVRDAASQQILAHLQPTGSLGQHLVQGALGGVTAPLSLVGDLLQSVQLLRIERMLETVQLLSGVAAAASVLNLGVTVGGFMMVARRLDGLQDRLGDLSRQIQQVSAFQRADWVGRIQQHLCRMDEAVLMASERQRLRYWEQAETCFDENLGVVSELLGPPGDDLSRALMQPAGQQILGLKLLLEQAHTEALLCLGEPGRAAARSASLSEWLDSLPTRPADLVRPILGGRMIAPAKMQEVMQQSSKLVRWLDLARQTVSDRATVTAHLHDTRTDTEAYMMMLRQDRQLAVLALPMSRDAGLLARVGLSQGAV